MTRKNIAAAGILAAGTGLGLLLRSEYERDCLVTETVAIRSPKIKKRIRLAFLTDLHDKEFGKDNRRLVRAIEEARPDAVLIGGDMMVCRGRLGVDVPLKLIEKLTKKYPVYYGNGNHENRMARRQDIYGDQYDCYRKSLEEMGVVILDNKTALIRDDIAVSGVDLEKEYYLKRFFHDPGPLEDGYLTERLGEADKERFQILLLHSPLYFKDAAKWGADLTLSGHFHGGTIRIPLLGGVMTPQYQFFLPCCAGTFEKDGKYLVVGRGLGTHSINIRLNDKPQVILVELFPAIREAGK